jgi:hypothetical protein
MASHSTPLVLGEAGVFAGDHGALQVAEMRSLSTQSWRQQATWCFSTSSRQASLRWKAGGLRVQPRSSARCAPGRTAAAPACTAPARRASQARTVAAMGRALPASGARPAAAQGQHLAPWRAHAAPERQTPRPPAPPACPGRRAPRRRAVAQSMKGCAAGAVHQVHRQRAGLQHAVAHRHARAGQAAGAAVDHHVEGLAGVGQAVRRCQLHAMLCIRPGGMALHQLPAPWRHVRLATTTDAGTRPRAAAPARPRRRRPHRSAAHACRPAARRRCCCDVVHQAPVPSVLSANQPSASKRSTLAAWASARAAWHALARQRCFWNLNGTVMLQPRPRPSAGKRWRLRTAAKPSSGHSAAAVVQCWPVCSANSGVDERRLAVRHRVAQHRNSGRAWESALMAAWIVRCGPLGGASGGLGGAWFDLLTWFPALRRA